MRFLKTLFWLLLGGVIAGFAIYNGDQRVPVHLWGGLTADFALPMLIILVFLAGFLPMLVAYHTLRWRTRQRIAGLERALAVVRDTAPPAPTVYAADQPSPPPEPLPLPPPPAPEGALL